MDSKTLGNAIRSARIQMCLSQEELAEIVDITPTHMKHIESGHRNPSIEVLFKLVSVLRLSLDNLIFGGDCADGEYHYAEMLLRGCGEKELKLLTDIIKAVRDNMSQ